MGKRKIINDPLYGFITFEFDLLYDLIDHRYFQRLRRISQMGLSSLVYPGAIHSRFHHALGALHLMTRAIRILRSKGVGISEDESLAACVAILLHDIGHGPFSHALERQILPVDHEELTLEIMNVLNLEFDGKLSLAIKIFKGEYERNFFHQLVSSQLDMDRLDYINRDSFFSGVTEGKVGYERIINMLNVSNHQLVVEEKAIYSVEKFILSRRMMYLQVYLHKTCLVAEHLLLNFTVRYKELFLSGRLEEKLIDQDLTKCLQTDIESGIENALQYYLNLDDINIWNLLKKSIYSEDPVLNEIGSAIVNRRLWKIIFSESPFDGDFAGKTRQKIVNYNSGYKDIADYFVITGSETNQLYSKSKNEIQVLKKSGEIVPFSELSNVENIGLLKQLCFLCYPKYID